MLDTPLEDLALLLIYLIPQGRVMGSAGTVTDVNSRTRSYAPGDRVGELDHKLVLSEIPSHNHDNNTPAQAANVAGNTSTAYTGVTDSGHQHTYINQPGTSSPQGGLVGLIDVTSTYDENANTSMASAVIVDPGHRHQIASNGGDQYHNNIQPTLFYGNTFIYSGIPMLGKFPFTLNTSPVLI